MAEEQESVITDEMRAQIGKESEPVIYEVDKTTIRLYARAVGYDDPLYYDEEFARSKGYRSLPAPPGFLGFPIYDPRNAGQQMGPPRFQTRLQRVLNGGSEFEYFDDICAGDTLVATGRITDIYERPGRMGLMLFTEREQVFKRDGKVVAVSRGRSINY
ncbi:MAG TPA: MaoC family dehydratase N-terminal domain-containing protein [Dehalococcoidia bacterium]|nr:MaoC family dehydratase N-terminal domain-containing protein [Dehalococcoidia bacterium]